MFFCGECEHSWPQLSVVPERDRQALAVTTFRRTESNPCRCPREQFVANVARYRLRSQQTDLIRHVVVETLALAAAVCRASRERRAIIHLIRRRESMIH